MTYEQKLKDRFSRYYDIEGPVSLGDTTFNFIAKFNQRNSKYVLKKSNEYYAFENNEFILYRKLSSPLTSEELTRIEKVFNEHAARLTNVHDEHMSTVVHVIIETEHPISSELKARIEGFKYYKSFMFGLKGWVNGGLMLINPLEGKGLSNKFSKRELERILS